MQLILEPTPDFFHTDDGILVRAWKGKTGQGVEVVAFITAIAARDGGDHSDLDAELRALPGPGLPSIILRRPDANVPLEVDTFDPYPENPKREE